MKVLKVSHTIYLFLILFSCSVSADEKNTVPEKIIVSPVVSFDSSRIDSASLGVLFIPVNSYEKSKTLAKKKLLESATRYFYSDSISPETKDIFEEIILSEIIPHWYSTPWDFNGYTAIPKKGVIACGYFVSTVLLHSGFKLDRYKLAQQNPFNEACTIAMADTVDIYTVSSRSLRDIFNKNYREGLYFAGLDFHVGFLLFRNKELYFIHSNYIESKGVMIEKAVFSDAFNASSSYRIAPLSTNEKLLKKWLTGEEIKVKTK